MTIFLASWDGEVLQESTHANDLVQLDNGVKVPPTGWKCERCELTKNLWLNLTDGAILCGRRFFDGSGGNNHAVDYYAEKKYPLVRRFLVLVLENNLHQCLCRL